MLNWMAWTWPTGLFFIGHFVAMGIITYIEIKNREHLNALAYWVSPQPEGIDCSYPYWDQPIFSSPGLDFLARHCGGR